MSAGDGTPYGSGSSVLWSLSEIEHRPPIWSRLRFETNWPPETRALTGRTTDPQVIVPAARNEPDSKPGKLTTTLPLLALSVTPVLAARPSVVGQGTVLENSRPVIVTAAEGCWTGVTTTVGT